MVFAKGSHKALSDEKAGWWSPPPRKNRLELKLPQNPNGSGSRRCPKSGKTSPKEGCVVRFSKDSSNLGQTRFVGRAAGNSLILGWQSGGRCGWKPKQPGGSLKLSCKDQGAEAVLRLNPGGEMRPQAGNVGPGPASRGQRKPDGGHA